MGALEAIWVKRARRGKMDPVDSATLVAGQGIEGNADRGRLRQVTLIEQERWFALMEQVRSDIDPSARRANLMIRGVRLAETRGRVLIIGGHRIRIRGETRPCERMDEAAPGLRAAMEEGWGGGAFGEVLDNGRIRVGDPVFWDEPGQDPQLQGGGGSKP